MQTSTLYARLLLHPYSQHAAHVILVMLMYCEKLPTGFCPPMLMVKSNKHVAEQRGDDMIAERYDT